MMKRLFVEHEKSSAQVISLDICIQNNIILTSQDFGFIIIIIIYIFL